jgi:hypothetical protein
VLFNKASRTEGASSHAADRVAYVNLYETDDDGDHWWPQITFRDAADWKDPPYWQTDPDERKPALFLDTGSLIIQEMKGVSYISTTSEVYTNVAPKEADLRKVKY